MRALAIAAALLLGLGTPAPAAANTLCRWTGFCLYLSPGFTLTVVDAETGQPLADVYAWAEWVQYGAHGRGGPLMVQDATSDAAGQLTFPRWGPRFGSRGGLLLGLDPAVILFKPGHTTTRIDNGVALGASHHAAIRGMSHTGKTLRLERFQGAPAERVEQLRRLVYPGLSSGLSDRQRDQFRALYLRRIEVVTGALATLPEDLEEAVRLQSALQRSAQLLREGE